MAARPSNPAIAAFTKFINARERHRIGKEAGRKVDKPDPIISKYRFCNVRRNDDRVTKFVHTWAFEAWRDHPELWFALIVARLFNNEDTLTDIDSAIIPYDPRRMLKILNARKAGGLKNFNAAYIVSTNGVAMGKAEYLIDRVLTPLWKQRAHLSHMINKQTELAVVCDIISSQNGFKTFMAAQVVADLKYAYPQKWTDFATFAASGPGSKRGLNRVLGNDKNAPMSEAAFRATLAQLRDSVNARFKGEPITAQDIQNCLCEYDKYCRVAEGDAPKQLYKEKTS
jgi:5-hmdU DNA kinase-like protein